MSEAECKSDLLLTEKKTEPGEQTDILLEQEHDKPLVRPIIAIDAGGVLVYKTHGDETEESRRPMEGAAEALQQLKDIGFKLCLVSFAGRKTAALNVQDMEQFYHGLLDSQIYVKNKLEKLAVCRSIGAMVLIDDTSEILTTLNKGLYLGTAKEIKRMDNIQGILFTGDTGVDMKDVVPDNNTTTTSETVCDNAIVGKQQSEPIIDPEYNALPIASNWEKVVKICTRIQKGILDHTIQMNKPDPQINILKYVYADLCVPPFDKPIPVPVPSGKSKQVNNPKVQSTPKNDKKSE